ncbi:MAG TPA: hypothetical protein VEK84_12145 [Terriglobales bacterium]|nr:hypothetical protein [Terriglobales bacterium]
MARHRPHDHLPHEVLARVDFAEACDNRNLGAIFRLATKWGGVGFTKSHIARRCEMSVGRVSDYIEGTKQAQSIEVFERVSDGLHIPGAMLGISHRPWEKSADITALPEDHRSVTSQRDWIRTRQLLNRHRAELTQVALDLYPDSVQIGRTGFLMPSHWRLDNPIDLSSVDVNLVHPPMPIVTGHHAETLPLRPLMSPGKHYDTYHRAMRDLDRPRLFENRICYRLLHAEWSKDRGQLDLGYMRYFDMIDVGEALAHELALAAIDREGKIRSNRSLWDKLPFRKLIPDPFDLRTYPLLLSICTLTIRRSRAGTTFVLLRRGTGQVAIAGGMLSVMPTGVFQPASILPTHDSSDFDMWHNMMREYSEEFLGNPEHDGDGDPIDYANQEPFRSLDAARNAGKIRVLSLGVGLDALNFVADVLTVAVFDADVFDDIFDSLVEANEEGTVASSGQNREHFDFDRSTIDRLLSTEAMAPSGAACLSLAWHHRDSIVG